MTCGSFGTQDHVKTSIQFIYSLTLYRIRSAMEVCKIYIVSYLTTLIERSVDINIGLQIFCTYTDVSAHTMRCIGLFKRPDPSTSMCIGISTHVPLKMLLANLLMHQSFLRDVIPALPDPFLWSIQYLNYL